MKMGQNKKYMCNGKSCCKGHCMGHKVCSVLLLVGGLNWGLIGLGMLMGSNLDVLKMIFGSMPTFEAIIYVLVGLSALMMIFGCRCKKCKEVCASCSAGGEKMDDKM